MPSLDSRALLASLVLLLVAVPLSGCASPQNEFPEHRVSIRNSDDEPHDVAFVVEYDGERLSNESLRLSANSSEPLSTLNRSGRYTLRLTVDGRTVSRTVELPVVEGDRRSFTEFTIADNGTVSVLNYHED
ncbi:hypothetical protein [Haladaptatus paucihalophilus]|uniref:Ig-like domain-containing protein n=1 Tax=Haladaptatus paucihalophilus DX253 TaxID=797209 RepID=A0A1M6VA85_HALPU|nr:hypothetical protein [Haladaptatus paucihalophilus]SHK78291.1 hypothetical protein SAMN05444342_2165 [Haladaptatus paucihalophilus DX253]